MDRSAFDFELPRSLIAQEPPAQRGASRLLEVKSPCAAPVDRAFNDLPGLLRPQDLLLINDTRVVKARLGGAKASGGRVEVLVERVLGPRRCQALVRASRAPRVGSELTLDAGHRLRVVGREAEFFELELCEATISSASGGKRLAGDAPSGGDWATLMEHFGALPLPPYISRPANSQDQERYQTVFARNAGAVAAPTAGLHFDDRMLDRLRGIGVNIASLTLHVGAGTFAPVRVDAIETHRMHSERIYVPQTTCDAVTETRRRGGRVIAVGTTCVRAMETVARQAADSSGALPAAGPDIDSRPRGLEAFSGETNLFILPGFEFRIVDCMITNFHLPQSTLLMLVCAFSGSDAVKRAYQHAVKSGYRFFSYGDACFLHRARRPAPGSPAVSDPRPPRT